MILHNGMAEYKKSPNFEESMTPLTVHNSKSQEYSSGES